jgi:uncharacterized phage protein gp47/JayE
MADALTTTGLTIDSLETRLARVKATLRAAIHPNLELSADQPSGQTVQIQVERIQALLELIREIYDAWDPRSATGHSLTALAALTGTYRHAATHGHVTLTLTLGAAVTVPAGSVAAVAGAPANRWATDEDVTSVAPGLYLVAATAEEAGAIVALAGTITVIATPVAGWTAVTNVSPAVPGEAEESDADLRARREAELFRGGSTSVDAIRADLLALADDGMIAVTVLENELDHSAGVPPLPPHSVEAIVWDGSPVGGPYVVPSATIAEVLWQSRAAGVRTHGTTTVAHTDDQGNSHVVSFSRVAPLRVSVRVDVTTGSGYVGNAAVQAAVAAWATSDLGPGDDVYRSKISGVAVALGGVIDVVDVRLSIWPAPPVAADLTVLAREIATIAAGDVLVV